ncbi:hypothetical protein [Gordonia asplenii]|uniref:hypothetical protein n=1 Tax=Gordonia asplenii TaxID=2725283 RepID=UPI001B7D4D94|nr:hypothetical protein [Gordonia asplenii]
MRPIQSISTRAELLALGFTDEAIRRAAKTGTLDYLGPGLYGPRDDDGTRESRHRGVVQAWARKVASGPRGERRALAEVSAAAALGLPLFGLPVNQFVAQDFSHASGSRSTRRVRLVSDRRPVSLVNLADIAIPVVSPARTVVDIARRHSRIPAIVVGDAALHDGLCTRSELHYELDLARGLCGVAHARVAVELMDGLSESVLESRSRIEMRDAGYLFPSFSPRFMSVEYALGGPTSGGPSSC